MFDQNKTEFDENSFEVKNAKMIFTSNGSEIDKISPPPVPLEVNIINVTEAEGKKYTSPFSRGVHFDHRLNEERFHKVTPWKLNMYEIETDIGVYISAQGAPGSQFNVAINSLPGSKYVSGAPVNWMDYVGKKVNVLTGPTENIPVWSWIYFVHENTF